MVVLSFELMSLICVIMQQQLTMLEYLSDDEPYIFPGHLFDDNCIADGPVAKYQGSIILKSIATRNTFHLVTMLTFVLLCSGCISSFELCLCL